MVQADAGIKSFRCTVELIEEEVISYEHFKLD
jgi:hypothetical protein